MKTMNIKSVCVFAIFFIIGIVSSAFSHERNPKPVLEFIGYLNSRPVYKLDIKNTERARLVVTIRDTDGMILHEEVLEGEHITRKYCFLREEIGNKELFVELARSDWESVVGTIRMERRR